MVVATALALTLATGGGTAWALNRYVIDHVQIGDVDAYEAAQAGTTTAARASGAVTVTDTSYVSSDASVTLSKVSTGSGGATVTYDVADVVLGDATRLRSAFAQNRFGANIVESTSDTAADNNAIFAVNGDYYGFRETGIVIRNGVVFRDEGAR